MTTVTRFLARPMLASTFVMGGIDAMKNAPALAQKAKPAIDRVRPQIAKAVPQVKLPEDAATLVRINAAAQVLAGAALATGRAPRLSSTVLAATVLPTTLAGHQFWSESDPTVKSAQKLDFFKSLSVLGALVLASVDTAGKPGVAWRVGHAAGTARRSAKTLTNTAKLEAKLAAKAIG